MALAVGIGWLFGRIMWPTTAASAFRGRVALQLAACLDRLDEARASEGRDPARDDAKLIRTFIEQSAALDPLDDLARSEPVELGLDPARRATLRAALADLVDAIVDDRRADLERLSAIEAPGILALREAMRAEEEALLSSIRSVMKALREGHGAPGPDLALAEQEVSARLDELRASPPDPSAFEERERRSLLRALHARRRLIACQRALETLLEESSRATLGGTRPRTDPRLEQEPRWERPNGSSIL